MTEAAELSPSAVSDEKCSSCERGLHAGRRFAMPAGEGPICTRCAMIDGTMLRRSAIVATLVGTLLVLLNQGDVMLAPGPLAPSLYWRIPATYLVPFCVATYGALANARH